MVHFRRILVTLFLIMGLLYPLTAGAFVAYSGNANVYGNGYGNGSYYVGCSQPAYYYPGSTFYSGGFIFSPTTNPLPGPSPAQASNPLPPSKPDLKPEPKPAPAPESSPAESGVLSGAEQQLLNLVNAERAKYGLSGLAVDSRLVHLARLKSEDMLDRGYFDHESPTYGSSGDMLRNADIKYYLAAENIGMGSSVSAIFSAFLASSGHRSKILDARYTLTGVGIVYRQGKGYRITQLFLKPR